MAGKIETVYNSTKSRTETYIDINGQLVLWDATPAHRINDPFIFSDISTTEVFSKHYWTTYNTAGSLTSVNGHGGGLQFSCSAKNDNKQLETDNKDIVATSGDFAMYFRSKNNVVGTDFNDCTLYMGLQRDTNNFIWFQLISTSDTDFHAVCESGGTQTDTDTGVTSDLNFHDFYIEKSGSNVKFYIDGTEEADISTNIPSGNLRPFFYLEQEFTGGVATTMTLQNLNLVWDI